MTSSTIKEENLTIQEEMDTDYIPRAVRPVRDPSNANSWLEIALHDVDQELGCSSLVEEEEEEKPEWMTEDYDGPSVGNQYYVSDSAVIFSQSEVADQVRSAGGFSDLVAETTHIRGKSLHSMQAQSVYTAWVKSVASCKANPNRAQACFSQLWSEYHRQGWQSFMNHWDVVVLSNSLKKMGAKARVK